MTKLGKYLAFLPASYRIFRRQVLSAHGNPNLDEQKTSDLYSHFMYNGWYSLPYYTNFYQHERIRFQQNRWLPAISNNPIPMQICWGDTDQVNPIAIAQHIKNHITPPHSLCHHERLRPLWSDPGWRSLG